MFENDKLICASLADAIPQVLAMVRERGRPAYVRGELNREVLGADIVISDPTDRLPIVAGRRTIVAFCITEFLWYCAQQTDLDLLATYAPNIRSFYSGQRFATGSDYGRQIFGRKQGSSQWENVAALLGVDQGSKRAYIGVYNADEVPNLLPANHDIACTLGFHVLVRDGRLYWITSMRANDAFRGFVSDIFSFTMLHELLAATVDIPIGQYLHRVNSLHTFPEDEPAIDRILGARGEAVAPPQRAWMPPIRPDEFWRHLEDFWSVHETCKSSGDWQLLRKLERFGGDWWRWVANVLLAFHGLDNSTGSNPDHPSEPGITQIR